MYLSLAFVLISGNGTPLWSLGRPHSITGLRLSGAILSSARSHEPISRSIYHGPLLFNLVKLCRTKILQLVLKLCRQNPDTVSASRKLTEFLDRFDTAICHISCMNYLLPRCSSNTRYQCLL